MQKLDIDVKVFSQYIINFINETNNFNDNNEIEKQISHLKLQKMLYFAYAYALTKWDKKLWADSFEKWSLGPVIRSICNEYSKYGDNPIASNDKIVNLNMLTNFEKLELQALILELNENFTAAQLSNISHSFPWENAKSNKDIKDQDMINYYSRNDTFINKLINDNSIPESNFKFLT